MPSGKVLRLLLAGCLIVLLAGAFSPAIGAAEPGVLEIWDVYYSPNRNPVVEAAIEEFKRRYPDWEVRRTSRPLEDMRTAVLAALAAGAGPDIMLVNNGENMMGPMVRAGHLVGLDAYAEKYGWTERLFSPSLWNRARYSEDGTQFGEGVIWGVGVDAEIVGVYYNMDILNALGLGIPESLAELQEVMEAVKQAGYAPVALGLLDDWQFFHLYGAVQHATLAHQMGADAAQEYLDDIVIRGSRDRTWLEPGNVEAARIVQEWAQKGYFVDGYTALGGDDALAVFEAGVAAIFIQGSWYSSSIAGVDFDVAFRPVPARGARRRAAAANRRHGDAPWHQRPLGASRRGSGVSRYLDQLRHHCLPAAGNGRRARESPGPRGAGARGDRLPRHLGGLERG